MQRRLNLYDELVLFLLNLNHKKSQGHQTFYEPTEKRPTVVSTVLKQSLNHPLRNF